MNIFGIHFAPLKVPLERRLQTFSVGVWQIFMCFGPLISVCLTIFILFYTPFWWLTLLYLIWILWDKNIHEEGGRPWYPSKNWICWRYLRDYFPITLEVVSGVQLDPKRNYIFACYPHGILCTGMSCALGTNANNYKQFFPYHTVRIVTLTFHFMWPFYREVFLALGSVSATVKSLCKILAFPQGGNVLALVVGGASESHYSRPGQYKVILKSRKGFVRLALQFGAPLVPVFTFGETELFDQFSSPKIRPIQDVYQNLTGMAPIIVKGRGFFQYSFGFLPQRRPLTTLVGKPIEVEKTSNPTKEQINQLHSRFTEELIRLFEDHKHLYLKNAENLRLEIT